MEWALRFDGAQYVTVRNFKVLGHRYGALFEGGQTSHNILEHCDISTGQARVEIADGAHHNHVRRNVMYMSMIAKETTPGCLEQSSRFARDRAKRAPL